MQSLIVVLFALAAIAPAQWVNLPTPGIPRTKDGKPNLTAPAPRTAQGKPDFSGLWQAANPLPCDGINRVCTDLPITRQFINIGAELKEGLPYLPWVRDRVRQKGPADDPYVRCIHPGGARIHLLPTMKKWIHTPDLLVILDEYNASFRQIFTDGRPLPEDPQPALMGYSAGRWEGDTLVVESNGFHDNSWLDAAGSALTSAGKVTERFRRPNLGSMEIEITVNDPKAYARPWTVQVKQVAVFDTELLDAYCLENEKDVQHLPPPK